MNKILMVGRLTKAPDTFTQNNNKLVKFTLACDRRKKDAPADFFIVNAWNNTGEIVERYCKKGSQIFVSGRMESREYTNSKGDTKKVWEIQAEDVELLGGDKLQDSDFIDTTDIDSDFGDMPF